MCNSHLTLTKKVTFFLLIVLWHFIGAAKEEKSNTPTTCPHSGRDEVTLLNDIKHAST